MMKEMENQLIAGKRTTEKKRKEKKRKEKKEDKNSVSKRENANHHSVDSGKDDF